jgi:hypothetical protein
MATFARRIYDAIIRAFLYPATAPPRALSRASETVIVFILLIAVVVAIPSAKDFVFCKWTSFSEISKPGVEEIKNWCDFIIIFCQVVIALMIGGVIFADGIVKWMRDRSEELQRQLEEITEALQATAHLTPKQQSLRDKPQQIDDIRTGIKITNLFPKIRDAMYVVESMYNDMVPDSHIVNFMGNFIYLPFPFDVIPGLRGKRLWVFLVFRYTSTFPGGVYGMIAFTLFIAMIAVTVAKTYFEYAPVCP